MEVAWASEHGMAHGALLDWDESDRAKLRAWLLEEASRCPMCGTQPWEWDPAVGGSRRAYVAQEHFCQGCYNKDTMSRDNESLPGTTIQLVPYSHEVIESQRKAHERSRKSKLEVKSERQRAVHSRPQG